MSDLESTLHVTATNTRMPKSARVVVHADGQVITVPLPRRGAMTIGRGADSDLRIDHPSVSRAHATLHIGPPLTIEDTGSHNGTRVRGARLEEGVRAPLTAGDVVKVGSTLLMVQPGEVASDTSRLLTSAFVSTKVDPILADREPVDVIAIVTRGPLPADVVAATLLAAVPREAIASSPKHDELAVVLVGARDEIDGLRERLEATALGMGIRVGIGAAASNAKTKHVADLIEAARKAASKALPKRASDARAVQHEAITLMNAAIGLYTDERYEQARTMVAYALDLISGDESGVATMCLVSVAVAAREHGDAAHAEKLLDEALALAKRSGNAGTTALVNAELARSRPAPDKAAHEIAMSISSAARKVVIGDQEIDLSRRRPLWLIVEALAGARQTSPGKPIDRDTLLEQAWPGERIHPEAALNRLYVAIATLRRLGIRDALMSRDAGYLFDPAVALTAT
jgi:pSer/pThr/pTyr-binding forkhead associated (FHA) protein